MATNIQVIPHLDPRIIKILAPVTTISVQDLTNQIKDWEDEPSNLSYPVLVNTAGKESLGGGVSVGITAELQNAKVMFEARTESDVVGIVTDDSSNSSTILIDENAAFGYLNPGDSVINMVTGAVATILSIDSGNQLTHEPLDDGTTNVWTYGDDYKIWNKVQCEINGGNLVAVANDGTDISPFLPSAFTHVIRTSASSATLQEQEDIQFTAFEGAVYIDATSSNSGIVFPTGTPRQPVNNLADAASIATTRGFSKYHIIGNFTFVSGDSISQKEVEGDDRSKSTFTFQSGVITTGAEFFDASIQGIMISPSGFTNCQILDITGNTVGATGTIVIKDCTFGGTVTLSSALEGTLQLLNCVSGSSDPSPIFNANGAQVDVLIRNYAGEMDIRGISYQYSEVSIDMVSGNIVLDSTNTGGTIIIRGISNLTDNSNGSTIDTSGLVFADEIQLSAFNEKVSVDTVNGVAGTKFPIGTRAAPVSNISDAIAIANSRGIQTLFVIGNITLDTGDNLADFTLEGQNTNQTTITVNTGAVTDRVEYQNCTLTGILDGGSIVRNGNVSDIAFFNGMLLNCMINSGTITLGGGVTAHLLDCNSGVPGASPPIIDMGASGQSLGVRGYNGGLKLINKSGTDAVSLDINSGQVILDSTVTVGTIAIRGIARLTDNSNGATIDTSGLIFADQTQLASFSEKITIDILLGTSGTGFPQGTGQFPVSGIDDALIIAAARGISALSIIGNLDVDYNDDISGFTIIGQSISASEIALASGCITQNTKFKDCTVIGEVNGTIEAVNCEIGESGQPITNVGTAESTILRDCVIHDIDMNPLSSGEFLILNCSSGDPTDMHPFHPNIDLKDCTAEIGVRLYSGAIMFSNATNPYAGHSIDMNSGSVHIRSTCTEGVIVIRGITLVQDQSGPNCTVNVQGVAEAWDQIITDHEIPNSFGKKLTDTLKLKRTKP